MNRVAQHSPPAAMRLAAWAVGLLLFGAALNNAHGAGTAAGTDVSNSATVNYSVGGVAQPQATSNTVTFEVDRRINLTVAEVGGDYTDVSPGQPNALLAFDVTNLSNSPLDFRLTFTQDATGTASPTGFTPAGTDNFNTTSVVFYRDDGDGVFDAGDTVVTFLDEVAADGTVRVFVESDIPAGQANASIAGGTLTAISAQSTDGSGNYVVTAGTLASDAAETNTGTADNAAFVDTVFGDTGAADGNTAEDGLAFDDDAYYVIAAQITAAKSSRVISDPLNGTSANAKAIPGAVVEYCIAVTNAAGGAAATNVSVSDALAGQPVTYNANSIVLGSTSCTASDGTAQTDAADADQGSFAGNTATGTFATVTAGSTVRMQFRVTIN